MKRDFLDKSFCFMYSFYEKEGIVFLKDVL